MADRTIQRETYASDFVKADTARLNYFGDVMIDNLTTTVVALGAEVWTTRRRMLVLESLLEDKGITEDMIESYLPSPKKLAMWNAERDDFVKRTMTHLAREADLPISADFPADEKPNPTVAPLGAEKPKS